MGDIVLMNVWELLTEPRATFPSGPEKWSFLRYRFDGAALAIDVLQAEPLKEQSHAQAVETVRRRINDDVLFEPLPSAPGSSGDPFLAPAREDLKTPPSR